MDLVVKRCRRNIKWSTKERAKGDATGKKLAGKKLTGKRKITQTQ